jgi:formylmethanofuran dehydrogenase subunit A
MNLKNWILIYSETCDFDRDNCDLFVDTLMRASTAYGIKISEP